MIPTFFWIMLFFRNKLLGAHPGKPKVNFRFNEPGLFDRESHLEIENDWSHFLGPSEESRFLW